MLLYVLVLSANSAFVHLVDWRAYQNPEERLLWDLDLPRTGLVIIGDSVFASSYVDSPKQTFSFLLQQWSGKKVFNGALEGADPPDFLNAAELLTSSGMKGATVVLDIMPNRFLEFNQLENPSGNQARRFERLIGHGAVASLIAEIRRPLVILDSDILMNCLIRKKFYGVGPYKNRVWDKDGDLAHRRFEVFQQQIEFGRLRSFAWVQELNSLLKRNDNKLVVFISPVNDKLIDTYSSKGYAARYHSEFSTSHKALLQYLDSQGIPYIDGSGRFASADFVDLLHVNAHGEQRIAELLDGYVTGGRPISASARQYTQ
ncbi:MAG TPA: hypothetical protein VJO35_05705 [Terriglobales bacterium]|nr:hypothetical protein [Terriglobales bacterium]